MHIIAMSLIYEHRGFLGGCALGGLAAWLWNRAHTSAEAVPGVAGTDGGAGTTTDGAAHSQGSGSAEDDFDTVGAEDRVLRKAETVLQRRTGRFVVVVERICTDHNHSAIVRTAEALGIQHLWLIEPPSMQQRDPKRYT